MSCRKLYYEDAYINNFEATVLSCERAGERWRCILDKTAFFPNEGGQSADDGTLDNVPVLDVQEEDGEIIHYLASPLDVGATVQGLICREERFRKMQSHSAEHILSGIIHKHFGYENTGFHLAEDSFVFDCGGELTEKQLNAVEREANEQIWRNLPVRCWFPSDAELLNLSYRSKLELTENVRLVQIGDVDLCACCAPHVARTGEIGQVKLLESMRHRGGMRIRAKAGSDALGEFSARLAADGAVSRLLSVPQGEIAQGVERLLAERDGLKAKIAAMQNVLLEQQIAALRPTTGNLLLFADTDMDGLRKLCNAGAALAGGVCGAFAGGDGAWRFVIAARHSDARDFLAAVRDALQARGGGKADMVSGLAGTDREAIEAVFQ